MKNKLGQAREIAKCLTGIHGFDDITHGGIPQNRSTLVVGSAGTGKTLFGMQFLFQGAVNKEPGLFIAFEETESDLVKNCMSLGFNLQELMDKQQIILHHIDIDRSKFDVSGEYNLQGLFIQIGYAIEKYKIKRIVIDTIEVLFSQLSDDIIIRSELQRLFQWLSSKKVTAVITGEQGQHTLTRYGLEEYVADCVIFLNNRVSNELSTRYLRILKYRGSGHGSNEYPFIIDKKGLALTPITSLSLDYPVSHKFISTGIGDLDEVLNGKGYYQGGSILINGVAGAGKSSFAAAFAESHCINGKKCIYFAFEESAEQIIRNMSSINIRLKPWVKKGNLVFHSVRPSVYGLESHLIKMVQLIEEFKPEAVVIDPISNLGLIGSPLSVKLMLARLINYLKFKQITTIMTSLLQDNADIGQQGVSSLMDTWLLLKSVEFELEQSTLLVIKKSRGMPHSRQMREVILSSKGISLQDVYTGAGKIVVGSTRVVQAMQEQIEQIQNNEKFNEKLRTLKDEKIMIESEIKQLNKKLVALKGDEKSLLSEKKKIKQITVSGIKQITQIRSPKPVTSVNSEDDNE
ncbi:circadian clock protein KaiC [Legionella maioricensis]|uniref:non-specific serine/threonine protein kinase n=1 Tax=Legionella maioricensis TaxID=2896528 RepID=A0A9X2IA82_9GAMM|nr:circadian clock protein KaiC [Legionella maioricensis]MCL9683241.1 circadian clock protein KaiC [Legionella maioricensis]MCL9686061.1 circadian clock protein KaiC [Legionella maioricensis]